MCLLFGMTHTDKFTRKQLNAVLRTVNKLFTSTQPDGFGFAIQNTDGSRYVERYVKPEQFAGIGAAERAKRVLPKNLKGAILSAATGELRQWGGGMLIHGRTSTNDVSLTNTHPFTKSGWTLAHNGIVTWEGKKRPLETTCDSEHILNCFALGDGLKDTERDLRGYAACLMLTPTGDFAVFRDDHAPLVFAPLERLNTVVFATRETTIRAVAGALRTRVKYVTDVEPDCYMQFPQDPTNEAGYTIEKHGGLRWGTGLGSGACRAFGWDGDDYHHYTPKGTEYAPKDEYHVGGHLFRKDESGKWSKVESDTPRGVPALNLDKSPAPEDMSDAEWQAYVMELQAEREAEDRAARATKSIHTMTDEELKRYGLD